MPNQDPGAPTPNGEEILERIQSAARRMSKGIQQDQVDAAKQEKTVAKKIARRRMGSPLVTAVACLALIGTTAANLTGNGFFQDETAPSPEAQYRQYLNFKVEEIQAYYRERGDLPGNVAEIDPDGEGGWEYERVGSNGFRLTLVEEELRLVHNHEPSNLAVAGPGFSNGRR